jgi:tellurite resistance protein
LEDRLEIDTLTLPLAELLLGKLQIVKINDKDLVDMIALLLEHRLGEGDEDAINVARVAALCAEDWGLWRTTTMNLEKLERFAESHAKLDQDQKARLAASIEALRRRLDAEPKPLAWRMRARIGERVKWYNDVEEVR